MRSRLWPRRCQKALLTVCVVVLSLTFLLCYLQAAKSTLRPITQVLSPLLFTTPNSRCATMTNIPKTSFIDTAEVYPNLDFTPRYGTFWNQTFEDRYLSTREKWKDLPLEVIVVPHSHNDPGWLQTFDFYYEQYTSKILDNMVKFLNKTEDFTFVWSEVSFFAKWWVRASNATQSAVKKLLDRHQLEIVTGGWVMTDEATTHYYAMIDQLVEGHQWLKVVTGIIPMHGWSVDIFGHSSTMPYLLSTVNITDTVILRIHYAWKIFLAERRQLDFWWKQKFESPDVLCHMAPSDLYSIKHTCGPDAKACLQYDFRRIEGEFSESMATDISNENIKPKAERLLSQYGRFGSLFPHNVLLVPLGDDFRFNYYLEWEQQYENYQKLFQYINQHPELNAHVRFGTVRDYFIEVRRRLANISTISLEPIQGDFLPYADTYSDGNPSYWTGFYTTRPFWKEFARELQQWLRATEVLFSLCYSTTDGEAKEKLREDYLYLATARQQLALFQHHDAITGTSKATVMLDYATRMHEALRETIGIISHAAQHILIPASSTPGVWTSKLITDVVKPSPTSSSEKLILSIPAKGRQVILYNSMAQRKYEPVRLRIVSPRVAVFDELGRIVLSQVNPVWDEWLGVLKTEFELVFVCKIEPLSLTSYTILNIDDNNDYEFIKSDISLQVSGNFKGDIPQHSAFTFTCADKQEIVLQNRHLKASFSSDGNLQEVYLNEHKFLVAIQPKFYSYRSVPYRSGGYLFRPMVDSEVPLQNFTNYMTLVRIIKGPVVSEVTLVYHPILSVTTRVYNSEDLPGGLELKTKFNLSKFDQSMELIMRLNSDIKSNDVFYTDSNGFQMSKRKYVSNIGVQGNYYPTTSSAYIEDDYSRMTVLVSHSHGVTSPKSGSLEIMLDRRLINDDSRGMGEGILDNKPTTANFWILPEYVESTAPENPCLSSAGHTLSEMILYPVITLFADSADEAIPSIVSFIPQPWSEDLHLVNIRTLPSIQNLSLPSAEALMVLHRKEVSCRIQNPSSNMFDTVISTTMFQNISIQSVESVTLTGTVNLDNSNKSSEHLIPPGTLKSYKITFR